MAGLLRGRSKFLSRVFAVVHTRRNVRLGTGLVNSCSQHVQCYNSLRLFSTYGRHLSGSAFTDVSSDGNGSRRSCDPEAVSAGNTLLEIPLGKKIGRFDRRWLRENCRCSDCFNQSTAQRNVLYFRLEENQLQASDVKVSADDANRDVVEIVWQDGHVTRYHADWLEGNSYPGRRNTLNPVTWDRNNISSANIEPVDFSDYMTSSDALKTVLRSLLVNGFALVSGVAPSSESTREMVERMCIIQETMYGRMWSFTSDKSRADTAYTNYGLGAHTDNTYLSQPAGIQVFHCLQHDGTGGETLLVDGFHAAEQLREEYPKAFDLLCRYRVHHENWDRGENHVRALGSVLVVHPATGDMEQVRYNHYDREPISTIPQAEIGAYYDALAKFSALICDEQNEFVIKLNPGTVVFVDNWRVLHGRKSFTGLRRVCGCYLPRDDWIGKARVLGLVP